MFDRPLAGARARARSDANLNPGAARARASSVHFERETRYEMDPMTD